MSEVEEFKKYAQKAGLWFPDGAEQTGNDWLAHVNENCPPVHQFVHASVKPGARAIRRVFRIYSGRVWASTEEILETTLQDMFDEFITSFEEAYASGYLCGRGEHPLLHGLQTEEDWHNLFRNEDFRHDALCLAALNEADKELTSMFYDYYTNVAHDLSDRVGFLAFPVDQPHFEVLVHKVWDIYGMVHRTLCGNLFACGYLYGQGKAVDDTLDGILRRTEEE